METMLDGLRPVPHGHLPCTDLASQVIVGLEQRDIDSPLAERGRRTDSGEPTSQHGHARCLIGHDTRPRDVDRLPLLAIASKPPFDETSHSPVQLATSRPKPRRNQGH